MRRSAYASTLAATLLLAACGSGRAGTAGHPASGDPAGSVTPTAAPFPTATGTPAAGTYGSADVSFASGMVPHHRQAVQMSEVVLAKPGIDPRVRRLATAIRDAQAPEIARMSGWLAGWGSPAAPETTGDGMAGDGMAADGMAADGMAGDGMADGMMGAGEMAALARASGTEATRLFLTGMRTHHQGAVAMAQTELARGRNEEARALASSITITQQREITEMDQLIAG